MTLQPEPATPKLGLLAGGGELPNSILAACQAEGRPVFVVTFEGQPSPEPRLISKNQHFQANLGAVGKVLKVLKDADVESVVMAGNLHKPALFDLRLDWKGAQALAKLSLHHDDALLRAVCEILEGQGFKVMAPHDLLPELLAGQGLLTRHKPTTTELEDARQGYRVAKVLGAEDIGQAIVIKNKVVIGVEAVEGTDRLLTRCADLRGKKQGGVLVKVSKPQQDQRLDLPSIGPKTIEMLAQHGYAGVALEAGATLILERQQTLTLADKLGVFVYGIGAEA